MSENGEKTLNVNYLGSAILYVLTGKVLPERANVNLPKPVLVKILPGKVIPEDSTVFVTVICSQISVVIHAPKEISDVQGLAHECEGMCRMIVDCLGFLFTCGYDLEITQVSVPGGLHVVYGVQPANLRPIAITEESLPGIFDRLVATPKAYQLPCRRALADYREAIRSFEDTAFFCYRAVEDLRQVFVEDEQGKISQTWDRLWEALSIPDSSRVYVKEVMRSLATGNRHGGGAIISTENRLKMLKETSKIIVRFIEWVWNEQEKAIN